MAYQFCMGEHEASGKLCVLGSAADTAARQGHCVGSKCMAWRWVETNVEDCQGGTMVSGDTHGYCGLAGEPWNERPGERWNQWRELPSAEPTGK